MATDEIGVEVDGLHQTGRNISGRRGSASSAAKGLRDGLDAAGSLLGHFKVKNAAKTFVDNYVTQDANKLPTQVDAAGIITSNVASTARDADEDGARNVTGATQQQLPLSRPINGPSPY